MTSNACEPVMRWESENLFDAFKMFKQRCALYFSVKNIPTEKQVDHILLLAGEEGIHRYNAWTFDNETDRTNPEIIWKKFEERLEPQVNPRISRFYLREFRQKNTETIDDFMARCKLQAKKCRFKDSEELEERLIEQMISGTKYPELQKLLLSKGMDLTLQEALNSGRTHEASLNHMRQMAEIRGEVKEVSLIKKSHCRRCGNAHDKEKCPAWGTTCSACGKRNHWAKMCTNKNESTRKNSQAGTIRSRKPTEESKNKKRNNRIYSVNTEPMEMFTEFEQLSFDAIQQPKDERTEIITELEIKLPNKPGTHKLKAKVDTGAEGNTLPLRTFRKMFPKEVDNLGLPIPGSTKKECTILTAYNGSNIVQHGSINIKCGYKDNWRTLKFFVVTTDGPTIIGLPSLRDLKLISLHCQIKQNRSPITSIDDLRQQYASRFDRIGLFRNEYHIVLKQDHQPIIHAPRKCPIHLRKEIESELRAMEAQGIIRKVTELTEWVSSIVYVRKKNGKLRLCLDPKDLNRAIMRCHYKTPTMEELAHKLSGAQHFSKLDAKNGYWSIPLDAESQILTTFHSPFGRFCFQRMPFGLVMSQDVFMQRMDMILEKCPGTIGLIDDVIVFGKTKEEHDSNLHRLMEVAQTEGLCFNSEKCAIDQKQINFFGAIYDKDGIKPDPSKVEAIKQLPSPTNVTELQKILGIITYLAPFIPHLSDLTAPLRDLLKKESDYQWTTSHQKTMQKIKDIICKEMSLSYFDPSKDTSIQVDASNKGLGAVLLQEGKPIAFASKALTESEQRYANIERELLAVVFGCERFKTYLYGSKFQVQSDHKPLEMISLKNLVAAPPRLQRMLLRLQEYDLTIVYRPGKDMTLADGFSRLPNKKAKEEINLNIRVDFVQFSAEKISQIKLATQADPILCDLKETIVQGWPDTFRVIGKNLRPYWSYRDEL
ncbi:hypothetical protein Ahia01_000548300 [Argonauta hians]